MIHNHEWYHLDNCTAIPHPKSVLTIIVKNREEKQNLGIELFSEKTPYKVMDAAQASDVVIDTNYVFIGKDFTTVMRCLLF